MYNIYIWFINLLCLNIIEIIILPIKRTRFKTGLKLHFSKIIIDKT